MSAAKPPRLFQSGLTGKVYVTTRYTEKADGLIVSSVKYDVTDDFLRIVAEREFERDKAFRESPEFGDMGR